jgi:PAS domain S-box-containing protein
MIAERELRKVLRAVEQSPVSIVITDPDGNIEYVNPKFVETTGYALDELVGRNPRILQSGLTPPERFKDLWDTITRGDVWEGVFVNRKKNGEIYWDQATIAPIRGIRGDIVGYVGAKVDITARMAEEEERARLTRIIETSQASGRVGSWEIDLDRGSVFMSAEAYRILELSPDSFTPTVEGLLELFEPESARDASLRIQQAIETGTTPDLDVKVITAAGHHKWLHLSSSVTSDGERATRITGAVQDITERKLAEHERIELTRRLSHVQKLESLGILAGGVAHDINNVLSAINNVASTHRPRVPDTDPLAHSLDTILKACQRGRSVVSSLLYFAREKVGARGIVDLNAIVREITGLLGQTTLERVRLTTDLQDPLDPIEGDAPAISQAIMNLCLNSVDAMPRGGELTIRTRRLESGQIELTVVDDGLGMSPEVLELAAEPFFTTKPTGKGTGLGLAMVYGTVTAHGGTLDIRSKLNHGTEVTLTFPSAPVDASVVLGDKSSGTSLQNDLHVLLVDDDELILETFVPLLEALGHRVKAVNSGRAALDAFKGGLEPELVILDMNMPGMTGDEALRRMLDIRPLQHVLICTGFSDVDLTELSSLGPYISSIRKPFTVEELEKAIHELNARP